MSDSDAPKCEHCGYEFTGLPPVGRCPECGQSYNLKTLRGVEHEEHSMYKFDRMFRRGRTLVLAALAVLSLLGSAIAQTTLPGARLGSILLVLAMVFALSAFTSFVYEKD